MALNDDDIDPLVDEVVGGGYRRPSHKLSNIICLGVLMTGCVGLVVSISVCYVKYQNNIIPTPDNSSTTISPVFSSKLISSSVSSDSLQFSVFSLMVWGSPGSFGVLDKETRVAAIGEFIAKDTDHDVFLLNDLWMRPDHMTIRKSLPKGYEMTTIEQLNAANCDGMAAPEFCSGLAIISKHPIKNVQFLSFTDHGDFFWDYEYFLRRGAGLVTLEPRPGHTVDVMVTSLASIDYNHWYREHQTADLIKFISHSSADHLIVAGDFNVDPRDNEETYKTVQSVLKDAMGDEKYLDPKFATLGNSENTYTEKGDHPFVYDYIFYKDQGVTVNSFDVLNLRTEKEEISLSDHQALSAKFTLTK